MPRALCVAPETPVGFWSFHEALRLAGRRAAFPPLGLLTVAAMLPPGWDVRCVDTNVGPLRDADLAWADVVLTSSMIVHWRALEAIVARCNARRLPVVNGGPLPTQYHDELSGHGVFFRGEAEAGFDDVLRDAVRGRAPDRKVVVDRRGTFAPLAATPVPRWDLVDPADYATMVVQLTRGCPEHCTFCNIPALYGRTTRLRPPAATLAELDALRARGWRGSVMVVDDNFAGNRDAIRALLSDHVVPWQRAHRHPFQLYTQASLRIADDPALLRAMRDAGFGTVFCGIESPVAESLRFMGARKNLQGDATLPQKVRTLQAHGLEVQAGFILGLDTDPDDVAERTIALVDEAAIPTAMVGVLGVLRDTPDHRRFARAGRLVPGARYAGDSGVAAEALSFVPCMPAATLVARHRRVLRALYAPHAYFARCRALLDRLGPRAPAGPRPQGWEVRALLRSLWRQGVVGAYRRDYWRFLGGVAARRPRQLPAAVRLAVSGHHLLATTARTLGDDPA